MKSIKLIGRINHQPTFRTIKRFIFKLGLLSKDTEERFIFSRELQGTTRSGDLSKCMLPLSQPRRKQGKDALLEMVARVFSGCCREQSPRLTELCFPDTIVMTFRLVTLQFGLSPQVTQPETDGLRYRIKGRLSGSEVNKFLQSSCGFVYARTRQKNVSRYVLLIANVNMTVTSHRPFYRRLCGEPPRGAIMTSA